MFKAQSIRRLVLVSAVTLIAGTLVSSANAAQVNIANGAPVIGGSGDYNNVAFNNGVTYSTSNVTDGQNASPNNNIGSTVTEPGQDGSYWLGTGGASTGYFVLDLGSSPQIGGFEIFNTRNGPYDDRGTGQFAIYGSNSITLAANPADGQQLGGTPVLLASGTLTNQTYPGPSGMQSNPGSTPLVADEFTSLSHAGFRYIEFQALSIGASLDKGTTSPGGVGLNELRIFSSPEPGSFVLMVVGAIGVAIMVRRRRRA